MKDLFAELKRRNVIRMAGLYLVGAWLIVQVAETLLPAFDVPGWVLRALIILLALGFAPALVFSWVFELTPTGLRRDSDETSSQPVASMAARRMDQLTLVGVLLVVGLIAADRFWPRAMPVPPTAPENIAASVVATHQTATSAMRSVAVLPFVDMSQGRDQEYFSDGLSEELLNLLAQLPQLKVIARTSSFSFKGKDVDVATIAQALDVAYVLEGSVRKSGNTLRITAQLIRASDSSHRWSQTYDRELTDVFAMQDEIAAAVVDALKIKLLPDQHLANPDHSSNAEAYNQYLLGKAFLNSQIPDDLARAVAAFDRAIALDLDYGAPRAALAVTEYFLADTAGDPASKQRALDRADQAVAKAPHLADAYAARGVTRLSFFRDWDGARADLEKALQLNAASGNAQLGYFRLLMAAGRVSDAADAAHQATVVDPLGSDAWTALGRALYAMGDHAEAGKALQRARQISPESAYPGFVMGMNKLAQGRAQEALLAFQTSDTVYRPVGIAMAEHSLGHERESQQALDAAITLHGVAGAYQVAEVYAWRGETDKAFEWLDIALVNNDGGLSFLKSDPVMKDLVDDPRYAALVKKLGLPE